MRTRLPPLVLLLLTLTACMSSATPPSTPTPDYTPTTTFTLTPVPSPSPIRTSAPTDALATPVDPPPRPFDYTVVNPNPPRRAPNATRAFWVTDTTTGERREIEARLRAQTEHVAMWVEESTWHDVRQLEEAAIFFEARTYPATRAVFGSEWTPGVDNDPRIHILHATGLGEGVLGYTSGGDEFPRDLYPFSNEAEMITVSAAEIKVGSHAYHALLARQFQRLVQWFQDRNEERWVKEGLVELAIHLNKLNTGAPEQAYLEHPDTSLVGWEDESAAAHRGAAYLFATYFHERFGNEGTQALMAQPLNGVAGFDAALADLNRDITFEKLFAEWLAANYLDGERATYGYTTLDLERPAPTAIYESYPVTLESSVQQYGADYILLQGDDDVHVQFTGVTATPLLDVLPHSGRYLWWSNRADESLTTLTRAFDLSGVEQATLTYWTWYDLEQGYDYATVEVSVDGGEQWQTLHAPSGSDADPNGNNPGWGYTGNSAGWVREEVDLAPWVGDEALVRFVYLTDEAVTGAGFLLDDVAIPEIEYADDVESGAGGWEAAGFVRSDNSVAQNYLALLIGPGETITVERLPVEEDQTAEWIALLGSEGWGEAVLVLSGLAPLTAHPALYELKISRLSRP
ncbi:MAG: hypothetical protein B6I35_14760 [Anaerolineaceae bacterium 4572_32.2]|nr:MAG: hypothetical protein B6I35_14760 [Anaerolineaceae bacterium 4572_32.2]